MNMHPSSFLFNLDLLPSFVEQTSSNQVKVSPWSDAQIRTRDGKTFLVSSRILESGSRGFRRMLSAMRKAPEHLLTFVNDIVTLDIPQTKNEADILFRMLSLGISPLPAWEPDQLVSALKVLHKYQPADIVAKELKETWSILADTSPIYYFALAKSKSWHQVFVVSAADLCFHKHLTAATLEPYTIGPTAFLDIRSQAQTAKAFNDLKLACKDAVQSIFGAELYRSQLHAGVIDLPWIFSWQMSLHSWTRCQCDERIEVVTSGGEIVLAARWWLAVLVGLLARLQDIPATRTVDQFCICQLPTILDEVVRPTCSCSPASVVAEDVFDFCIDVKAQLTVIQILEYRKLNKRKAQN